MARAQVLFSTRGPSVFRNVRKTEWNTPLIMLHENATETLVLDLAEYLDTGETVSTATVTAEGITCTATVSSPTVSLSLSAPQGTGDIDLTITLSSGHKWAGTLQTEEIASGSRPASYA